DQFQCFIKRVRDLIAVTALQSFLDPRRVDINAEEKGTVHRRGEWLGAAHSAESAGQNKFSFERAAELFSSSGRERFESSLHDSLTTDIKPRTRGHLAVHRQAKPLEPVEFRVVVPVPDEI